MVSIANRVPLSKRPLDFIYFLFFLVHIPAALCVDLQVFYPERWVPSPLKALVAFYFQLSGDPMMRGAFNLIGHSSEFTWFKSLLGLEAVFSLPMFFIGAYGLYKNTPRVYLPLLIYAVATTTTLVPVLGVVSTIGVQPGGTVWNVGSNFIKEGHRAQLFLAHGPFAVIPFIMSVDMAYRLSALLPWSHDDSVNSLKKTK
ncbi:Transmembrane protein 6/97 [Phaffia rhodozyma]|uniref:Transmembrane protein 6/97 n=1 Tax=Phaffia rhodozyma TaxID=264483 RepID=A0A0F7SXI2_PHARH|nr:Transmembrane protein 6/97 [Phaffia rhodozyma]